jgi:hypothetical protein
MNWMAKQAPETAAQIEIDRIVAFETTLVKRIMANVGVNAGELRTRVGDAYVGPGMQWLRDQTQFPVMLGAAKISWMQKVQIGDLFGPHFMKTKFFTMYMDFVDMEGLDDRRDHCGLVFNWPGIPQGGNAMVLHNYPVDSCAIDPDLRTERGTRIVRPYGNPLVIYVIESFSDFLLSIGTNWFKE